MLYFDKCCSHYSTVLTVIVVILTEAAPGAPTSLHIKEVEGNSLVLAWLPPVLDQHGCNNGVKVVGYRVSVAM